MNILILRTFAETNIWEDRRDSCQFFKRRFDQTQMIYKWEPKYTLFDVKEFGFALGIYTNKYFNYQAPGVNRPVFRGSDNEQIISILKLKSINETKFYRIDKDENLHIYFSFIKKMWDKPDRTLMNKIDEMLIYAKKIELNKKYGNVPYTSYTPLSFTLELEIVEDILLKNNINI